MGRQPKMTKAERERIEKMMTLGCVYHAWFGKPVPAEECHHIIQGNKRMGHWYTIPLCKTDHANINSLTNQRNHPDFPTERDLWEKVQKRLHLPTDWPESKIVPRKGIQEVFARWLT